MNWPTTAEWLGSLPLVNGHAHLMDIREEEEMSFSGPGPIKDQRVDYLDFRQLQYEGYPSLDHIWWLYV